MTQTTFDLQRFSDEDILLWQNVLLSALGDWASV